MKKYYGSKTSKPNKMNKEKKDYEIEKNINNEKEKPFDAVTQTFKLLDKTNNNKIINNAVNNKMMTDMNSYLEARQFLIDHNITISTITLDCKLHTLIDIDVFAKNVELKENEIVSVKFGNRKDVATNRTIVYIKPKKKPSMKNFYNQVTILMKPNNNPSRNYINIKVFKNGSLQITGCKDMCDFYNVINTLIRILKQGKDVINKKGQKIHKKFIDSPDNIGIFDVKVRMINSNFKLNYKVDRKKLAKILKKNHKQTTKDKEIGYVECKYEPAGGHSCVNIKYRYDDVNKPSIFVFQTGAIIITGAKNLQHIIMAYIFIQKILNRYYNEIKIIELNENEVQTAIIDFFKEKKKDKNLKNMPVDSDSESIKNEEQYEYGKIPSRTNDLDNSIIEFFSVKKKKEVDNLEVINKHVQGSVKLTKKNTRNKNELELNY